MAAIISTYRHDYVAPQISNYNFVKKTQVNFDPCKELCPCVEEKPRPDLSALGKSCERVQWTGPAPCGKVPLPRKVNEPPLVSNDQLASSCSKDKPNRFLNSISNAYPELYERLKNMPQDELRRSIENTRFRTTYQVDYCHQDEHPTGLYEDSQEGKESKMYSQLKVSDPCEMVEHDYKTKGGYGGDFADSSGGRGGGGGGEGGGTRDSPKDGPRDSPGDGGGDGNDFGKDLNEEETKMSKPVKTDFLTEASRAPTSHWDEGFLSKQLSLTEYMDTVCRTGFYIIENDLHDHSKCQNGKNCLHQIKSENPKGMRHLGVRM